MLQLKRKGLFLHLMTLSVKYGKKMIATFLLCLFTFISVEKIIHEHSFITHTKFNTEAQSINHQNKCSVCEFQIAADADVQIEFFTGSTNYPALTDVFFLQLYYYNLAPSRLAERGPPALG